MSAGTWQEQLEKRFNYNVRRVENLMQASTEVDGANCKGDVLRAAVVLLHATTEDVMRTCQFHKLLNAENADALDKIPLAYDDKQNPIMRFSLGQVRTFLEHRKRISAFIKRRIQTYLDRQSYNNAKDLESAARTIGVAGETAGRLAAGIEPMMKRRHQIVHQSDRMPLDDDTHGSLVNIEPGDIEVWIATVRPLVAAVLEKAKSIETRDPHAD